MYILNSINPLITTIPPARPQVSAPNPPEPCRRSQPPVGVRFAHAVPSPSALQVSRQRLIPTTQQAGVGISTLSRPQLPTPERYRRDLMRSVASSHLAADPSSSQAPAGGRRGRIRSSSVQLPSPRRSAPLQGAAPPAPRRSPRARRRGLPPRPPLPLRVIHPLPIAVTLAAAPPRAPQPSRQPRELTPYAPKRSPLTRGHR